MRAPVTLLAGAAALALGGCAGETGRLRPLKPVANPGAVVAAELAFARTAQEQGQWTAFRKYAGKGAVLMLPSGPVDAKTWLSKQADPAKAVTWEPLAIWSSCDGSIAVSRFAFAYPDGGPHGEGFTVWQHDRSDRYHYLFDFGFETTAAPAAPEMIRGEVAECKVAPANPSAQQSDDGSLAWTYGFDGGVRSFQVWISGKDGPQLVIDKRVPGKLSN